MIIFWQNTVSPHQAETLKALAETTEVRWYVDELMSASRKKQGWTMPDVGTVDVKKMDVKEVEREIDQLSSDTLHVFSPRGSLLSREVGRLVVKKNLRYAILGEVPNGVGVKLQLRKLLYRLLAWKFRRAEFTLAMGEIGASFYEKVGFPHVYPFAYTVANIEVKPRSRENEEYKFICVARLIPLKQHQLIFQALAGLAGDWSLTLLGRGELEKSLKEQADGLGLSGRIKWIESLENKEARQQIADSDTLILASDEEGWGAVINEAVQCGTRVIVSNAVGASCLCQLPDVGDVFLSKDKEDLRAKLEKHIQRGVVTEEERQLRSQLSQRFDGQAMATYFFDVMQGNAQSSAWK